MRKKCTDEAFIHAYKQLKGDLKAVASFLEMNIRTAFRMQSKLLESNAITKQEKQAEDKQKKELNKARRAFQEANTKIIDSYKKHLDIFQDDMLINNKLLAKLMRMRINTYVQNADNIKITSAELISLLNSVANSNNKLMTPQDTSQENNIQVHVQLPALGSHENKTIIQENNATTEE